MILKLFLGTSYVLFLAIGFSTIEKVKFILISIGFQIKAHVPVHVHIER